MSFEIYGVPIIALMDGRFPRRRMVPPGLPGLLVHVVEEILDEWVARVLGGLRAHTNNDPIPDLSRFSNVLDWNDRPGGDWSGDGELPAFPESTPFAEHVLALGRNHYAPFLLGNAQALADGAKAFVIDTYGAPCSYLARLYPEQSRRMIKDRIRHLLSEDEQAQAKTWLQGWGLADCFWPTEV